jgi:hypothetical protein
MRKPNLPHNRAARRAFWRNTLAAWESSGRTQRQFCAQAGVGLKSFARWRGIFARETPPVARSASAFVPLRLEGLGYELEIEYSGLRVRLRGVQAERVVARVLARL